MRAAPVGILIAILVATLVVVPGRFAEAQPVFPAITGPSALAPGQAGTYNVTIAGGPAPPVLYNVTYYITGADLTGGTPQQGTPGRTSGNQTTFRMDVTAPRADQTITLVVLVSATAGGQVENATASTPIVVITPIVLQATFRNSSLTAALNVTVRFFVDGILVGTRPIVRLNASAEGTVSINYLPVNLAPGTHSVRAEADLDGDGTINPSRGEVVVSEFFIQETPPLGVGLIILIGIAVAVPVFLLTAGLRRRKRP